MSEDTARFLFLSVCTGCIHGGLEFRPLVSHTRGDCLHLLEVDKI
jgi:hypothetical protein